MPHLLVSTQDGFSTQPGEESARVEQEAQDTGLWQIDLTTRESIWWPGMDTVHGLPPGTPPLHGEHYLQLVHPDDRDRFRQAVREAIAGLNGHRLEYRVVWPDGSIHWLEARTRTRVDEEGRPVAMAGVCVDITRRLQVERDLKFLAEASAELASLTDYQDTLDRIAHLSVPHFADWCSVDLMEGGKLVRLAVAHVDPKKVEFALELHRRYPIDLQEPGGAWAVLQSGRSVLIPEINDDLLVATAGRRPDEEFYRIVRTLGLYSYLAVPLAVRDQTIGVLTFISAESRRRYGPDDRVLAEDLGRRAAVAIENARLLLALQESDRAKDVFLATLAHELRNPLAPIWNGLSIIKRAKGDAQRIEQVSGIIERQVGQLSHLVDDLLDVSRISAGKIELKKELTNLVHVIGTAVEMSRPHIEAAHHKLSISFPNESTDLSADPARLAQVFSNLLNNAAKYTRRGGRIDVIVEAAGDELIVRVRDNGTGIAPEMLGKVFGLFTQVTQPSERRQGGLGIGLSLVDGLVRLHGGRVEAHSAGLEQGCEFTVVLPRLRRERVLPTPAPAASAGSREARSAPPGRRLLVVDDNEDAASTVAELLQMGGNEVVIAHDGASAVERTADFRPDVVLLDIGLPDINGYEVARRIRRLEGVRQPILIALTGWGQQQDKQAAAQAGIDHHWTKPVDPARLQELATR